MATVHSYTRFSSMRQAEGDSLDRQDRRAAEWVKQHGHTLSSLNQYRDLGVSSFRGKNAKEGALARFFVAIKEGKIAEGDILLIESIDRLSRQGVDQTLELIRKIHKAKVHIAVMFPTPTLYRWDDKDTFIRTVILATYAHAAYLYSARLSDLGKERWKKDRKLAKDKGTAIAGVIPWWLIRKGDKFIVDEEKAATIKYIYDLVIQGHGVTKVVSILEEKGIKPPRKNWTHTTIRELVRKRLVLGEVEFCEIDEDGNRVPVGDPVSGYYPQVIDPVTYEKASAAMSHRYSERGPSKDRVNLLPGLIHNVVDDSPMHIYHAAKVVKGKRVRDRRLRSYRAIQQKPGADTCTIELDWFEKLFLIFLYDVKVADIDGNDTSQQELKLKLARLEKIGKLIDQLKKDIFENDGDYEFLRDSLRDATEEKKQLQADVKELSALTSGGIASAHHSVLTLAKDESKRVQVREAIKSLISKIYLMPVKTGEAKSAPIITMVQIVFRSGVRRTIHICKEWGAMYSPTGVMEKYEEMELEKQNIKKLKPQYLKDIKKEREAYT